MGACRLCLRLAGVSRRDPVDMNTEFNRPTSCPRVHIQDVLSGRKGRRTYPPLEQLAVGKELFPNETVSSAS